MGLGGHVENQSSAVLEVPKQIEISTKRRLSDRIFRGVLIFGGLSSFFVLLAIFLYLVQRSLPVLKEFKLGFFTNSIWYSGDGNSASSGSLDPANFGLLPMLYGSLLVAVIAMCIAVPISVALALGINFYLPKRLASSFTFIVDLAASVPSVVFGIWGLFVLVPHARYWAALLNRYLDWIPLFNVSFPSFDQSPFVAGLVLALMITPIVTSISREIFSQTPLDLIQAAYALGATRAAMIRSVVLPFGKGGIVGGAMLGLGRALGETVAVFFVLQLMYDKINFFRVLESEGGSIASLIVARYGEATEFELAGLFGAGLALFLLTLAANFFASFIINRSSRGKK
jgi:phosphate transport system permease protein